MSKKIVTKNILYSDAYSVECKARALKKKLFKVWNKDDILSRIEQIFKLKGYCYTLDKLEQKFEITISSNVNIIG